MAQASIHRFKQISAFFAYRGFPKPLHPDFAIVNLGELALSNYEPAEPEQLVLDFYMISFKKNFHATMRYGQQTYQTNDGVMVFLAPGQVFGLSMEKADVSKASGWVLFIHPDFLWNSPLAATLKKYEYFGYAVYESLVLTEKEENVIRGICQNIETEYLANLDAYTQELIITQVELLLTYADRFYNRQFLTRKKNNHDLLNRVEALLHTYFQDDALGTQSLPTAQFIADQLHLSTNYLNRVLKMLTGKTTQQHIHEKLIEKAKEQLSTTQLSVSEIAYQLGFEHPQSFSKLFKDKTSQTPLAFRERFN